MNLTNNPHARLIIDANPPDIPIISIRFRVDLLCVSVFIERKNPQNIRTVPSDVEKNLETLSILRYSY